MIRFDGGHWTRLDGQVLCPDLARLAWFGVADNRRGRVVLWFFRLMELWPL